MAARRPKELQTLSSPSQQRAAAWSARARNRVAEQEIEPSLLSLVISQLRQRSASFSPGKAIGAIITHLGQSAFVALATFAGLAAICVQLVAARMRALNSSKSPRVQDLVAAVGRHTGALADRLKYSAIAGRVFDQNDIDGDNEIDKTELYCLVLQIYTTVINYFPSCLYPPSKIQTDALFVKFDLDRSGHLSKEEFVLLASVLVESIAMRIAAQISITLLAAPLIGTTLVNAAIAHVPALPRLLLAVVPSRLAPYVGRAISYRTERGVVGCMAHARLCVLQATLRSPRRSSPACSSRPSCPSRST